MTFSGAKNKHCSGLEQCLSIKLKVNLYFLMRTLIELAGRNIH